MMGTSNEIDQSDSGYSRRSFEASRANTDEAGGQWREPTPGRRDYNSNATRGCPDGEKRSLGGLRIGGTAGGQKEAVGRYDSQGGVNE